MTELDIVPTWIRFINNHPYCREHGALLGVSKDCRIWRCPTCHRGIEYEMP